MVLDVYICEYVCFPLHRYLIGAHIAEKNKGEKNTDNLLQFPTCSF